MGIRFNEYDRHTIHPEADPIGMSHHLQTDDKEKNSD
jgi:hypothetical protein